jgi:CRP-like cAMP-binding protein
VLNSILLNTANVLYVFCYGVRDVLWLRILAVAAMFLLLPFYANRPEPLIGCMLWQLVFIAINVYWIVAIFRERRPPTMNESEQQLYNDVFKSCCTPQDMLKLLEQAKWIDVKNGVQIVKQQSDLDQLLLIHSGIVSIQYNGDEIATLRAGNLVGEMSFLTGAKTIADVVADGPVRYLSWSRETLERMFATKIELKSAIYHVIGRDVVHKLAAQREHEELIEVRTV